MVMFFCEETFSQSSVAKIPIGVIFGPRSHVGRDHRHFDNVGCGASCGGSSGSEGYSTVANEPLTLSLRKNYC